MPETDISKLDILLTRNCNYVVIEIRVDRKLEHSTSLYPGSVLRNGDGSYLVPVLSENRVALSSIAVDKSLVFVEPPKPKMSARESLKILRSMQADYEGYSEQLEAIDVAIEKLEAAVDEEGEA